MADPTPDSEDQAPAADDSQQHADLHYEALKRFDRIVAAVQEERALALRDRRFATIAGAQWEGVWGEQFENSIMVEVNKTAAGLEKIIADYRANRFIVDFRAADDSADDETAELLNGMLRADFYCSKGQQAVDMAFEEAVQGGMGAWRLANDYEDAYDPDNDHQRICFKAIPDADQSVFWDPNAKLYDKSDAEYCFVVSAIAREVYEETYGDLSAAWPDGLIKTFYEWYRPDVVKVAEYYEVREKEAVLRVLRNKATGEEMRRWAADLDAGELEDLRDQGWNEVRTRRGKRRQVWKTVLSGNGVLVAPKQIAGCHIPVIPVYGKRWFIDNMERSRGHVRLAVDPQRIYNGQIAKLMETAAAAPIERPVFLPEQVAGLENHWAEANIKRSPYALINPVVDPATGAMAPIGPIAKIEPPQLSPVLAALVQITRDDIAELTTADDGADEVQANVSAEAMDLAAQRTDSKAEIYMDNLRQSWQRCGEVYYSMATDVYVEDGRSVSTLSADGKSHSRATLLEAYADDKGFRIRHDLGKGRYEVVADVTEATTTRRDKTAKTMVKVAEIAAAVDPQLAAAALNTAVMNIDGEGADDFKDWVRQRLVQQGVVKPTDEEKQQMAQAAAQQQQQLPDPQQQLAMAMAEKAQADTGLSKAKTILTLAQAKGEGAKTENDVALAQVEHADAVQKFGHAAQTHAQTMAHAEQAHAMDMATGAQAMEHAHQQNRVGLFAKLKSAFAPKGQGVK
jgi:uncharacterized tellurite resistance protein B-like protein